jgi:hypothetical protein
MKLYYTLVLNLTTRVSVGYVVTTHELTNQTFPQVLEKFMESAQITEGELIKADYFLIPAPFIKLIQGS